MSVGGVNNNMKSSLYTDQADEKKNQVISDRKEEKEEKSKFSAHLQDEYISSQGKPQNSTGIYRIGVDENGKKSIMADDKKVKEPEKETEKERGATANTDIVDAEIKQLKETKKRIEQQMNNAGNDPDKLKELKQQLSQIDLELSQKDNDNYRRQNAMVSYW